MSDGNAKDIITNCLGQYFRNVFSNFGDVRTMNFKIAFN